MSFRSKRAIINISEIKLFKSQNILEFLFSVGWFQSIYKGHSHNKRPIK